MLWRIAGQSSSDWCRIQSKYLKESTPSKNSAPSSPVRLKVDPVHFAIISTYLLQHLICVFWLHRDVQQFLMNRPADMCIHHKLKPGSGSFTSWTTAICDQKRRNMTCSCSLPALCATTGKTGTGHLTDLSIMGKDTTLVVVPSPF